MWMGQVVSIFTQEVVGSKKNNPVIFTPAEPQKIMIDHLSRCHDALCFIGMGIGKTAAVLHHLNDLFRNGDAVAALIVAPLRVINLTWPAEVRDWDQFSWMRVASLRTGEGRRAFLDGSAHIYTLNYEAIPKLVELVEKRNGVLPYDVAVFDEISKSKNPSSKRITLYRKKIPRASRHIGLTGTPMPNESLDLFAQVRLIDNGKRLGDNFYKFRREHYYTNGGPFDKWKEKRGTKDFIEKQISDITITLKSSDWLNIPDTVYEDVEVAFPPDLMEKYRTLEKELVMELKGDRVMNVANAAALVTKLLQFTSGHVYDEDRVVHPVHDLKFDTLAKIAKTEKKPLLVACIYQHEQERIRARFPQARFFEDAKTTDSQETLMAAWNAGKVPLLVAHPASAGHGLNLQHGSSVLVWMTLTYSRELYEQMIARLARRGQTEITKVYRLMVPGTADEAVAEALASKAENEARLISALQMLESFRYKEMK